jgi:putative ABC transport system substrate-binding protein
MRRRFITIAACVLAPLTGAPKAVSAQGGLPVVGFMNSGSPGPFAHLPVAFRRGLGETGFEEGRNVAVEPRRSRAYRAALLSRW